MADKLATKKRFSRSPGNRTSSARAEYLRQVCGNDQALLDRVETLLRCTTKRGVSSSHRLKASSPLPLSTQPIAEEPGNQIGPYKLLQQIGEVGLVSSTWPSKTEPVERRVALKINQAGHGHPAGDRPLRGRRTSPGHDGPPQYRKVFEVA